MLAWQAEFAGPTAGGHAFDDQRDRAFAFDGGSTGNVDHVVAYRPGTGAISIFKADGANKRFFGPIYHQPDPGNGLGVFGIQSGVDRGFAFDFDSTGKPDHIVFYRRGSRYAIIFKGPGGGFAPVFVSNPPNDGIGGYDLASESDHMLAFDYNKSGKLDHILIYRAALQQQLFHVISHSGGGFYSLYASGSDLVTERLNHPAARIYAIDYTGSGKKDHVLVWNGINCWRVLSNTAPTFTTVFEAGGLPASFHIGLAADGNVSHYVHGEESHLFPLDFLSSGQQDHMVKYDPANVTGVRIEVLRWK